CSACLKIGKLGNSTSLEARHAWMLGMLGCTACLDARHAWMLGMLGCSACLDARHAWMLGKLGCSAFLELRKVEGRGASLLFPLISSLPGSRLSTAAVALGGVVKAVAIAFGYAAKAAADLSGGQKLSKGDQI
ncbi:hypothetical protein Drorol1_Dr00027350, partial [Drosera rotundifolia]